ncbi:hypothetical protein PJ985_11480 [Streptomyces sp. ACA25]|uniref:SCO2583 family membrane protein n=1 Tax=Streptomyces sp. ACA25 TaxID=3022596 RepID=UPI0023070785|nr:hypothetical protein [Streptomyces sp. ACA25]MDB1088185.1 hypothetical protein [Streptomyces sp. ACA25]
MTGRTGPPEGTPGGVPGGGDEELRSTVFDESFIRAAQLEEFSARQRLEERTSPVRDRPAAQIAGMASRAPKQGLALALVVLTAIVAAIYLGGNNAYGPGQPAPVPPPHAVVIPLVPQADVPGGAPRELYAHSPAAGFGTGAGAVELPDPGATENFTREEVLTALGVAKEYVVASSLTPEVLTGATALPVRALLRPEQQRQLDGSLGGREDRPPATGWLVRFDSSAVSLADPRVRGTGQFTVEEQEPGTLSVTGEHVLVYAVRSAESVEEPASLFVVQRTVRLTLDEEDLIARRVVVQRAEMRAGPMDCAAESAAELRPLLAGEEASASGPAGTDPFQADSGGTLCGTLDPAAQPALPGS